MVRKTALAALVILILALVPAACSGITGADNEVLTFSDLIVKADDYNGKKVTVEGFYFSGFEIIALAGSLGHAQYDPERVVPEQPLIWTMLERGIQQEIYTQTDTPSGYPEYFGKVRVTGEFETGETYGHMNAYKYRLTVTNTVVLDWTPPVTTTLTTTSTTDIEQQYASAQQVAEDFIENSTTFLFDGIQGSIKLISDEKESPISAFRAYVLHYEYQTSHPGHGDRSGQVLAQVITLHQATIMVDIDTLEVKIATCDNWNMQTGEELPPPSTSVSGTVISGGDTTTPDGPMDTPRKFVYRVLSDTGIMYNVTYTAYPPSPVADQSKIILEFEGGEIHPGDRMQAYGNLDEATMTLTVVLPGQYVRTFVPTATVEGTVLSIQENVTGENGVVFDHVFELLRNDGTYVNVGFTPEASGLLSLYRTPIQIGDYMKAIGKYDKTGNLVIISGPADLLKTYASRAEAGY